MQGRVCVRGSTARTKSYPATDAPLNSAGTSVESQGECRMPQTPTHPIKSHMRPPFQPVKTRPITVHSDNQKMLFFRKEGMWLWKE